MDKHLCPKCNYRYSFGGGLCWKCKEEEKQAQLEFDMYTARPEVRQEIWEKTNGSTRS